MVLLIDANIILDVLLNRQEFVTDSSMIWKLCETGKAKGYVSALTFANLVYIMRKQLDPATIEDIFRKLNLIFDFTDFSVSDLTRAAGLNWKDFEDDYVRQLEIKGFIVNNSGREVAVPVLRVDMLDKDTKSLQVLDQKPSVKTLQPGGRVAVSMIVKKPSPLTKYVYMTFIDKY